jgi:hypothetical protein
VVKPLIAEVFKMTGVRCLYTVTALFLTCTTLFAKGGTYRTEDRYNPQHIDSLPPEIRSAILRRCNEPMALHPFASYSDAAKRIELHFEHFVCGGKGSGARLLRTVRMLAPSLGLSGRPLSPFAKFLHARWR